MLSFANFAKHSESQWHLEEDLEGKKASYVFEANKKGTHATGGIPDQLTSNGHVVETDHLLLGVAQLVQLAVVHGRRYIRAQAQHQRGLVDDAQVLGADRLVLAVESEVARIAALSRGVGQVEHAVQLQEVALVQNDVPLRDGDCKRQASVS